MVTTFKYKGMRIKYLYKFLLMACIVTITSCEDDNIAETPKIEESSFNGLMDIDNTQSKYYLDDTIWFYANIKNELTDNKTGKKVTLENQTFILSGTVNLLKPEIDTLPFIYQNFHVIENIGEIQLINVINTDNNAYTFDIRFGKPINSNEVKFGLLLNYRGILAIEYKSWVYFGSERDDYNDFSTDNSKGYIDMAFNNADNLNDSIYFDLPNKYRNYFDSYYTATKISANKFYFIEVAKE